MGDDYIDGIDFELGETGDAAVGEMPWAVAIITKGTAIGQPYLLPCAYFFYDNDTVGKDCAVGAIC